MNSTKIASTHITTVLRHALLFLSIAFSATSIKAVGTNPAPRASSKADTLNLEFRQGKSAVIPGFGSNDSVLREIRQRAAVLDNPDSLALLRHVSVTGAASPEGSVAINRRLSRLRADNIFDYLSKYTHIPDSLTSFSFLGRDWTGLRDLVEADSCVPYREETLNLIDDILGGHPNQEENDNLLRLKSLRGGVPYAYMYTRLFPELRKSSLIFDYYPSVPLIHIPDLAPALYLGITDIDMTPLPLPIEKCTKCCRNFYMDLRTNMLFDALLLPNIGAEFYLGKNWSVIANWMYGWWDKDKAHRYWRAYGGDLGVRRWFGRQAAEKPLTGHHVGLYGGAVTYDFEFGGKGYMGGKPGHNLWDRCNWFGGIEYGYSLPIARRLNIDFTIGLGYLGGKLLEYTPEEGHYVWQKTKRLHWFGPTKAEISLVWLIGCGNFNNTTKKGGSR